MKIDIRDIPTYRIKNTSNIFDRKKSKHHALDHVKYLDIDYISNINIHDKLHLSNLYLHSLISLSAEIEPPFILLENEAAVFNTDNFIITYPDDADAVYLGIFNYGFDNILANYNESDGLDTILAKYNEEYGIFRIYNMLGMYAILYNSKSYIQKSIHAIQFMLDKNLHGSRGLACIMKYYKVYALYDSLFYQYQIPEYTKFHMSDLRIRDIFY